MIRKLQRKFIMITMSSLLGVIILLIGAINIINFYQMNSRVTQVMDMLVENQGKIPKFNDKKDDFQIMEQQKKFNMNEETAFQTRYFFVELDLEKNVNNTDTGHIAAITASDAQTYAQKVLNSNKTEGFKGIYRYEVVKSSDGYMIMFMDCRSELETSTGFLLISIAVGIFVLLIMFILISVFSKKAIHPITESMEKQKQFITDAGHEIKTPLAIISANTDVLELTNGESEWTQSIKNQIIRLDKLVKNLLSLAKMEEENVKITFRELNLSETVDEISQSFKTFAESKGISFKTEIAEGLKMNGDPDSIQQLVSTLIENAVKYANENGEIRVSLLHGKKGPKLEVFNTVEVIEKENLDRLFERFYRDDSSRARETGGYGIGLSIARSIAEAHQGKISAKSEDGKSVLFQVKF